MMMTMTSTRKEVARIRKTGRKAAKPVVADPDADVVGILHLLLHHLHGLPDSESSFARKVKRALERSRTTDNKAKESDRILVPEFPQPENYRNWRIPVSDAVIEASAKPDLAFQWVEEVFKTDQSVEALKDSGKFVTLDAKLMSSLTNICEGDIARQLDIFKEEQAKSGTPARGRQALLMIHKNFSTSRKHGAVYDIEDLMAVTLVNDDLRGFITRWDAVIAGMTSEPDMMWKQAYFHNAIKNFKPLMIWLCTIAHRRGNPTALMIFS